MNIRSQFGNPPKPLEVSISDYDPAVPDLSFTVRELQEKFTLQTQVVLDMMSKGKQLRYEFKNISDENVDDAFDSPAIQTLRGVDLVDIAAVADSIRRIPSRLETIRSIRSQIRSDSRVQENSTESSEETSE